MRILTWNINGLRSLAGPLKHLLDSFEADLICFQETKVTRDQLEESVAIIEGYNAYFSFSKVKSGYSGVVTFCRHSSTPFAAEDGLSGVLLAPCHGTSIIGEFGDLSGFQDDELKALDSEGRTVITQHNLKEPFDEGQKLVVVNVYCPRADPDRPDRQIFKLQFYKLLQIRCEALRQAGNHVIIVGDLNTAHKPIDHCDPGDLAEFRQHPGRLWMDQFILKTDFNDKQIQFHRHDDDNSSQTDDSDLKLKLIDLFRYFHPRDANTYTCWNTMLGARQTNYGTRIDYIFADLDLVRGGVSDCWIRGDIQGSDHCPVVAELKCEISPSEKLPSLCTKFMPEFAGTQQKLQSYFTKKTHETDTDVIAKTSQKPELSETILKRPTTDQRSGKQIAKKPKLESQKSARSKQITLTGFFPGKPTSTVNIPEETGGREGADEGGESTVGGGEIFQKSVKQREGSNSQVSLWKNLMKAPDTPLCKGHSEPALLRVVKKQGPNFNRKFFVCARPQGHESNPEARCNFFEWVKKC